MGRTRQKQGVARSNRSGTNGSHEVPEVKLFKAQTLRVLLALCTLASSALVLEAGYRW